MNPMYVAFIEDPRQINEISEKVNKLGLSIDLMLSADEDALKKLYDDIYKTFLISVFVFVFIKLLYLKNYFNKEKHNISIFCTSSYPVKEISNFYLLKSVISNLLVVITSLLIYKIGVYIYSIVNEKTLFFNIILPWYLYLVVWIIEFILDAIIIKVYFQKVKKMEVSEFLRHD